MWYDDDSVSVRMMIITAKLTNEEKGEGRRGEERKKEEREALVMSTL